MSINGVDLIPAAGTITYEVLVGDTALPATIEVASIVVDNEVGTIPSACLRIIDGLASERVFSHSDGPLLVPGNTIEIRAGWNSADLQETIFKGIIVKQSLKAMGHGSTCTVLEAKSKAYQLCLGRTSAIYENLSNEEIVKQLLGKVDLSLDGGSGPQKQEQLVQFNATNWDFLMTRADASGKLLTIDGDSARLFEPDLTAEGQLELSFGETLLEFESSLDSRTQPEDITLSRWQPVKQQAEQDNLTQPESSKYVAPGSLSTSDLTSKTNFETDQLHFGGITLEDVNMKGLVKARLLRARLAQVRGRGKVIGCADLKPGMMVKLAGLNRYMNGNAFVSATRHEIGNGYWHTQVQFGMKPRLHSERYDISTPPGAGIMPSISGLQIGVVGEITQDDKGLERLKVILPVLGEDFEVLARLSSFYTGDNRGVFFPPKKDDEVILGFIDDDPGQAIVLGSLYNNSTANNLNYSLEESEEIKGIYLTKDFKLEFQEGKQKQNIVLQTPDNRRIVLEDIDQPSITLEDNNNNKIKMDSQGITIESGSTLNLKGKEVKIDATTFTAESQTTYEISGVSGKVTSTGLLDLKGGQLHLNT